MLVPRMFLFGMPLCWAVITWASWSITLRLCLPIWTWTPITLWYHLWFRQFWVFRLWACFLAWLRTSSSLVVFWILWAGVSLGAYIFVFWTRFFPWACFSFLGTRIPPFGTRILSLWARILSFGAGILSLWAGIFFMMLFLSLRRRRMFPSFITAFTPISFSTLSFLWAPWLVFIFSLLLFAGTCSWRWGCWLRLGRILHRWRSILYLTRLFFIFVTYRVCFHSKIRYQPRVVSCRRLSFTWVVTDGLHFRCWCFVQWTDAGQGAIITLLWDGIGRWFAHCSASFGYWYCKRSEQDGMNSQFLSWTGTKRHVTGGLTWMLFHRHFGMTMIMWPLGGFLEMAECLEDLSSTANGDCSERLLSDNEWGKIQTAHQQVTFQNQAYLNACVCT